MKNYNPKKVLITSYYYPPEITPRSFRTNELVKEFDQRGYEIDLYIPEILGLEYNDELEYCNTVKVRPKVNLNRKMGDNNSTQIDFQNTKSVISLIKKGVRYLIGDDPRAFIYSIFLYRELIKSKEKKYDLIISIGLPYYIHLATAMFISNSNQSGVKICDYGDPFFFNPGIKKARFLKYVERWSSRKFNFITIPNQKSISYYTSYKSKDYIKVIPQGFDFSGIQKQNYKKNEIITFCYAGVFYETIRNPEFLFKYLSTLDIDFRFVIYTRLNDDYFKKVYNNIPKELKNKIILNEFIPRDKLIQELSSMDFLINIDNKNSNQSPSKLIDYMLSNRPTISVNAKNFDRDTFERFLNGDYSQAVCLDIEAYNIINVVDKFENILNTK